MDERRANLGDDGRISCIICCKVSQPFSEAVAARLASYSHQVSVMNAIPLFVRELLADLISSSNVHDETFQLIAIELPQDIEITTERAAAITAQQIDHSVLDQTRIRLNVPPYAFQTIEISYSSEDAKVAAAAKAEASDLDAFLRANPPQAARLAAEKLIKRGFAFKSLTDIGVTVRQPVAVFFRGSKRARVPSGICVTLRWLP
jgi:hypothetical protein